MRAVALGDSEAFSQLYDILSVATYSVFRRYLPRQEDADIAMNAMWVSVWQNARSLSTSRCSVSELILAAAESQARSRASSTA